MMETPVSHWSYSALNTYLQCPMRYKFRYVEHAPEERFGACFAFGRAFHAVLSQRAIFLKNVPANPPNSLSSIGVTGLNPSACGSGRCPCPA